MTNGVYDSNDIVNGEQTGNESNHNHPRKKSQGHEQLRNILHHVGVPVVGLFVESLRYLDDPLGAVQIRRAISIFIFQQVVQVIQ